MPTEIELLYREHRAGLVRLVERELRDHHDAEDVVQSAFLDAQRALERGTIPRNPGAWLAAIALNAARRLRRRRLNAEPLEDYAVQEASEMSEIRAALTTLPRTQRAAVLYRDVLGLSYGETAEQMGTSVNAVTMLLHRGRRRLRQALGVAAGAIGVWRWLRRAGTPQAALAKGTAAIVASAGLATGGVVAAGRAARVVAPIRTATTAVQVAGPGSHEARPGRRPGGTSSHDPARRQFETTVVSRAGTAPEPTQGAGGDAAAARSSTAGVVAPAQLPSTLRAPTVSLPTPTVPTLPATVAATVTVATPITTTTVTASVGTTVTAPITTVTLPIP